MYQPPSFSLRDQDALWNFVRERGVGLLVSQGEAGLLANLIPFQVTETGGRVTLRAHLARANSQWNKLAGQEVLAVFQGVDAYVSPQWYTSKREHGKVVPTWNYAMVQVEGRAEVFESPSWLLAQVSSLTDHHEGRVRGGEAWKVTDAPSDFITSQIKGIVGIEIEVSAIQGKLKTSQNRPESDRDGVVEGLSKQGSADQVRMAGLVKTPRI